MQLPKNGISGDRLIARMETMKVSDADWRGGRTWSLIYPAGEHVDAILRRANELYLFENALNPFRFPSLRAMETEVVAMTAGLLHAEDESAGAMTSGGTESILMAVKTARDRARTERGVTQPQMLVPFSAHPAFAKAGVYLGLELVPVPLASDLRADVAAAERLINERTVLLVGSAPCYPFGLVDPIPELASLALERGISFHTDACVGGFLLPFLEKLSLSVPPWDFRVPGVTTISADVHKYGYCTKGASVILHRTRQSLHEHQLFVYDRWPGGLYGSLAMAGARPAAPIAAAWAVMNFLGEEGYLDLTRELRHTSAALREGIAAIPGLELVGDPQLSLFAFTSRDERVDIFGVGDVMDDRGWHLDRQGSPDALHMMVSPQHSRIVSRFLEDLSEAVETHGAARDATARYS
ncbi:MAG: pyridoxal phosphate-dependent decarboxylase family protein [Myxococcota bacterium]